MTRTKARRCDGKHAHKTRKQALAHMWSLVYAGAAKNQLDVYRCDCGFFHVGHRMRYRRRSR